MQVKVDTGGNIECTLTTSETKNIANVASLAAVAAYHHRGTAFGDDMADASCALRGWLAPDDDSTATVDLMEETDQPSPGTE